MAKTTSDLPVSLESEEDGSGRPVLLRWVERPDGRLELLELPLTPELFLEPQLEDQIPQGEAHNRVRNQLFRLLSRHFASEALVTVELQHDFGIPGLPRTSPDISVILGARRGNRTRFSVKKERLRPSLILEILYPYSAEIRQVDEVDKVEIYERAGIPEYLIVDLPRHANQHRFRLKGYRLSRQGRYRPIEPDDQGHLLFETVGLWFTVSAEGDRILVFDRRTGERLLYSEELEAAMNAEAEARQTAEARAVAAEENAARETEARKAAEEKAARLLEELERLKRGLES